VWFSCGICATLVFRCCAPCCPLIFFAGIGTISCPDISREEIVNACGIDDFHDGARLGLDQWWGAIWGWRG